MEYRRYRQGGALDRLRMAFGGKMVYAANGTEIDGDPKKKPGSPYETTQETVTATYRNNEGMQQATTAGKIDAYNFELPASGRLDDMDDEMKQTLVNSPFGKQYLSGEGSLDEQYNKYATAVVGFMKRNPDKALEAINQMIESGNKNFQGLANLSDAEKLERATQYMTDKKIGDFHGALKFGEAVVPSATFYDPTDDVVGAGFRGAEFPKILSGVGGRTVKPGDISLLAEAAEDQGVDLSQDNEASRKFVNEFMDERGSQQRGPMYDEEGNFADRGRFIGADNQYFINLAKDNLATAERTAEQKAAERRRREWEKANQQKANMALGGMIYKRRAENGIEVKSDEEETSAKRGIFNTTQKFGDDGKYYVKTRTGLGRMLSKYDVKASF